MRAVTAFPALNSYTLLPKSSTRPVSDCYKLLPSRFGIINDINIELKIQRIKKNQSLWQHISTEPNTPLRQWLNQFRTKQEKLSALDIVERIKLYTLQDMRTKLVSAHEWLSNQSDFDLEKTKFVPLGVSNSGSIVSSLYRQSNALPTIAFADWNDIKCPNNNVSSKEIDTLVILDDFIGTGKEAQFWLRQSSSQKKVLKKELNHYKNVYLISIAGYAHGRNHLASTFPKLKIHIVDHHKKFYTECNSFDHSQKTKILSMMHSYQPLVYPQQKYGKKANPLGFNDGQSLVCFFYNTPSNVPPIIWSEENGWKPLIKRYHSVRDFEEYNKFKSQREVDFIS